MGPEDQGVGDLVDLDPQRVGSLPRSAGDVVQDSDLSADTRGCQGCGHPTHAGVVENVPARNGHVPTVGERGAEQFMVRARFS